jgi:hypothetical protein
MKKKYFAPEMEEVKIDEVVVLDNVVDISKEPIADCSDDEEV